MSKLRMQSKSLLLALLGGVFVLAGCSGGDDVVIRVDDTEMTRTEFLELVGPVDPNDPEVRIPVIPAGQEGGNAVFGALVRTIEDHVLAGRGLAVTDAERDLARQAIDFDAASRGQEADPSDQDVDNLARTIVFAYSDSDLDPPDPSAENAGALVLADFTNALQPVWGAPHATEEVVRAVDIYVNPDLGWRWDADLLDIVPADGTGVDDVPIG